jgi:hypothetical protein
MKIILDGSFPAQSELYGEFDFALIRWSAGDVDDLDLIAHAAIEGFDGVVFLGQGILAQPDIHNLASQHRIYIAASVDPTPMGATRALAVNLTMLQRRCRPGVVDVIYAREIRSAPRWWENSQSGENV